MISLPVKPQRSLIMSSVTTIIDVISYVLIAFVAISLIVSSIMIGIITYISVLERTKEIGILRAIGASKKDISRVFNAETLIHSYYEQELLPCKDKKVGRRLLDELQNKWL